MGSLGEGVLLIHFIIMRRFSTSVPLRLRQNHYDILGVSVNASPKEIKRKFYELSRHYHPDRNKDTNHEKYQQITAAYAVLSNKKARHDFDMSLGAAVRRPGGYRRPNSQRSWQGTARAASGHNFQTRQHYGHRSRHSAHLDPLRPRFRDHSVNDAAHFDYDNHLQSQLRYEALRKRSSQEQGPKVKENPPMPTSGTNLALKAAGCAMIGASTIYLLLR